ncbi:hypothetical protein RM555_18000 [Micromonospora sp. DSM 115977]|uniref:Oligosaccharide repeat unit polymerase n=1 Tax=Micromonospora reichwaldensis TaxID=3075516 RepID=A0ABU2WY71_9ACTN|nr:hypothetical protein [Micromonospora sp. DSM 115977]MDT0530890.1 hypothetical protein [Micromonospora sp. DSM 115977]
MTTIISKRATPRGAMRDDTGGWNAAYIPLKLAVAYLAGTYVLFLTLGRAAESPDLTKLTLFVSATMVALCVGYVIYAARRSSTMSLRPAVGRRHAAPRRLVVVCATYVLFLGVAQLNVIGISGPAELAHAVTHPGERYFLQLQQEGQFSRPVQLLTLLSALYPLLIPVAVLHWSKLGRFLRLYVLGSLASYAVYYMAIGILKGLGDMLIWWAASYLLLLGSRSTRTRRAMRLANWRHLAAFAAMLVIFLGYMSFNQSDRARTSGQGPAVQGSPLVAGLIGEDLAAGLAITISYPTHGYLGLSHNLSVPFEWTRGTGSSPALSSYLEQYTDLESQHEKRYTARTEVATGWPDGMYWSTIYPWLASDLTYPGAILLMAVVGWFLAKFWHEAVLQRRVLSMALFGQLALLIAFVPANNQLGQTRPALIGFVSLCTLSILARIQRRVSLEVAPADSALPTGRHHRGTAGGAIRGPRPVSLSRA